MITMSTFGNNGRCGNQLFQYASMIGLAKKHNTQLVLPRWEYQNCFEGIFPEGEATGRLVQEPVFNYKANWPEIREHDNADIKGYFQSELYWSDAKEEVKKALTFKQEYKDQVWNNFFSRSRIKDDFRVGGKRTLAISIRRGDYVNHPSYAQLPVTYYILALFERFPDWREWNIIVFSDDIPWCRVHWGCLPNVFFSENNSAIEDICLMSQSSAFIIANSTFGWWGAYLAELQNPVRVIRPNHHFDGKLMRENDVRDLYPTRWEVFDHKTEHGHNKKINLKDCSFQIPVFRDSLDREENLALCIKVLQKNFDTEIMVTEQGGILFEPLCKDVIYGWVEDTCFHRTRMLNKMAQRTTKPIIFNWDADVFIAPLQIWLTAEALRNGAQMCYPYEWQFARIPRQTWFTKLRDFEDIGIVGDTRFSGMEHGSAVSLGGAVAWDRKSFLEAGGENEIAVSYDCEDVERYCRAVKLELKIERVLGPMYHINHFCGVNSTTANPHYGKCRKDMEKQKLMNKEELKEYINTWPRKSGN